MTRIITVLALLVCTKLWAQELVSTDPTNKTWWPKVQELICGEGAYFVLGDPHLDSETFLKEIQASVPQFKWEQHAHYLRCGAYEMNIFQYFTEGTFDITNKYFVFTIDCLSEHEEKEGAAVWRYSRREKCMINKTAKGLSLDYEAQPKPFAPKVMKLVNNVLHQDGFRATLLDLVDAIVRDNDGINQLAKADWITVRKYLRTRGALKYGEVKGQPAHK